MPLNRLSRRPAVSVGRVRRRPAFGLDAVRPIDAPRLAGEIGAWLAASRPDLVALPFGPKAPGAEAGLVVLGRGLRALVLVAGRQRAAPALADVLKQLGSGAAVALVSTLEEARAALRRHGFEGEA